jgi:hypothetical protein
MAIMTMALMWTTATYFEEFLNPANEGKNYTPKSKRKWTRPISRIYTVLEKKLWSYAINKIDEWEARLKVRKRMTIARKMAIKRDRDRQVKSRPAARPKWLATMAFAAVVMSAEAGKHDNQARFDTDSILVGVDNRATACMSDSINDFEGELIKTKRAVKGFHGTKSYNVMMGTLVWTIEDDQGCPQAFRIPNSFYIPEGKVKLLSPQHWAQGRATNAERASTTCTTYWDKVCLSWDGGKRKRTIPLTKGTNVATLSLAPGFKGFETFIQAAEIDIEEEERSPLCCERVEVSKNTQLEEWKEVHIQRESENEALRSVEFSKPNGIKEPMDQVDINQEDKNNANTAAEFLRYHVKYGHATTDRMKELARQGIIPKRLEKCPVPVCSSCMYGKATKRQWRQKSAKNGNPPEKAENPGDVVSVDQMVSHTPGLIAQMTGWITKQRYRYATIFVEHRSDLTFIYLQRSATADETIEGKKAFEKFCAHRGVQVSHYHADNGIFKAAKFVHECRNKGQSLSFASVNAHHQNGRAERRIRTLQEMARTQLIHAHKRWPMAVTTNLWPYAMRMAANSLNETPNLRDEDKRTPHQILSGGHKVADNPKHFHPFGCPAYVLDNDLQSGKRIRNKWKSRSRIGLYLGRSPIHARSVALVLNLETGYVSPQFHVKMDPAFHTVKGTSEREMTSEEWLYRTGFRKSKEKDKPRLLENDKRKEQPEHASQSSEGPTKLDPSKKQDESPKGAQRIEPKIGASDLPDEGIPQSSEEPPPSKKEVRRRSQRNQKGLMRLMEVMTSEAHEITKHSEVPGEILALESLFSDNHYSHSELQPLLAFKASSDPDILYWHEAMKQPDAEKFKEAAEKEVRDQMNRGVYNIVPRNKVPKGVPILPAVWAMRRKRRILSREVYKWKARLNYDGSKQVKGRDYDLTYAPVAGWTSIRLLLILVLIHGWSTQQIDFTQAYNQAPVERDQYMSLPRGFRIDGVDDSSKYCLRVMKNNYGAKQASRVWNKYLVAKLEKIGFVQSKFDECIFYRNSAIYLLYTDDSIIAAPTKDEVDKIVQDMKSVELEITLEGTLTDFVGVNITRNDDGTILLSQPQLVEQILKDLRMKSPEIKVKEVPMKSSVILKRHADSPAFDQSFHYRSVIGKLNYLEKATRADISYATHQCARFCEDPRKEHGDAVRWLSRYLKGTKNRGLVLDPDASKGLEVHVDASFTSDWDPKEALKDKDTARSRHGYVISYAGCPLVWKSQLQNEVAMSTTEAEFTGLSYSLREAIPTINLINEMKERGFQVLGGPTPVKCKVFEDNSGALELATVFKARPRTKHINTRLWHFHDYVTKGIISVLPCPSEEMPADILTKPTNEVVLAKHRRTLLGWESVLQYDAYSDERAC